jgi:tight adherence protein B
MPRRTTFFATLALAALVATVGVVPAVAGQVTIKSIERQGERLIMDLAIPGGAALNPDEFEAKVNGLSAETLTANPDIEQLRPAGAALLVDATAGMTGTAMESARRAVGLFLKVASPDAEVALLAFGATPRTLTDFTEDHSLVRNQVQAVEPEGQVTAFATRGCCQGALLRAISLANTRPRQQRNVVLFTNGANVGDTLPLTRVAEAARDSGAHIYIVGLEGSGHAALEKLADATGAHLLFTSDVAELRALFGGMTVGAITDYRLEVKSPDPLATKLDVEISVPDTRGATATGARSFDLPLPTPRGLAQVKVLGVPLYIAMLAIFLGLALFAYVLMRAYRIRKDSPATRVAWYVEGSELDPDAYVSAAIVKRAQELAEKLAHKAGLRERLEKQIDAANLGWRPGEVLVAGVGLGGAFAILGLTIRGPVGAAVLGFCALVSPLAYLNVVLARRRKAFRDQLSDVLVLLSGALRAGHSVQQALAAVGDDAKAPASEEFRRVMAEIRLGTPLAESLQAVGARMRYVAFDWTVLAIQIQREVGGNLAEILDVIAETIRDRERLLRHIKALTAEGRLSAIVLGMLPVAMAAVLLIRSPDYLEPLYTTGIGLMMILGSLVMMGFGVLWMRKIIRIEI